MRTLTPAMMSYWLNDIILYCHQIPVIPACDGGIRLLENTTDILCPGYIYIGTSSTASGIIANRSVPDDGIFLILSRDDDSLSDLIQSNLASASHDLSNHLAIIETSLDLFPLYNRVQEHIRQYLIWDSRLHDVVYTNAGLQTMLERAATILDATILLVNAGYKNIASVYHPEIQDATADELRNNGYQSFDTIQQIRRQTPLKSGKDSEYVEYRSSESNNYTIVQLIRYQDNLVARLCVILNGPNPNPCYSDLSAVLASYVSEYMFSNQGADYASNAAFGSLAADLIECRLTDPQELEQRLKQIQLAVRRYYHVMLVSFDSKKDRSTIPWNYIISQLEYIFPFSNITIYKGEILLIIRKMKRGSHLSFRQENLLEILEHYNGYACIGNSSEFLTSLPPVYHQTKSALRLGQKMNPDQRIIYYEDYSIYQVIEMAAESARQTLGSRNLVHLCNNEIIALILYDKKKGTNLTDVAYAYLSHERNTSETAKALFIHRNTMINKIHKIEEVIGESLENPLLRERMMFSYHVLTYMKQYRKEDILTLKPTSPDYQNHEEPRQK